MVTVKMYQDCKFYSQNFYLLRSGQVMEGS